jgi:hypothetical protein
MAPKYFFRRKKWRQNFFAVEKMCAAKTFRINNAKKCKWKLTMNFTGQLFSQKNAIVACRF